MAGYKFNFGMGTRLSLVAAVGIVANQLATKPSESNIEAARSRAEASTPPPPLKKPEPGELLRLDLQPAQRLAVTSIDAEWKREQKAVLALMEDFEPGSHLTQPSLKSSLEEYSQLSRQYDDARKRHWERAVAVLSPAQQKEIQP